MKRKAIVSGESDSRWYIEKSPVTGKYYEIRSRFSGNYRVEAMSEVTEQDYLKYLDMIGGE